MALPGTTDSNVQVAPDSTGKKVFMFQATDAFGNTVQVQAAQLIGSVPDDLAQIRMLLTDLLAVNRAQLAYLQQVSSIQTDESDFASLSGPSFSGN